MAILRTKRSDTVKYFTTEKWVLKVLGLSFSGNESIAYKIYAVLLISCTNFMYPLLQFRELFKQDFEVVSDMLIYLVTTYVCVIKTSVVALNRIQFGKMLNMLQEKPFIVNLYRGGLEEKKINEECIWITNFQMRIYYALVWTTVDANIVYTLIKRIISSDPADWQLPFGPLTILNTTQSPYFEITWFYQVTSCSFIVAHFITIDLLMAAVMAHMSYQFKMLQNNIGCMITNCLREMRMVFSLGCYNICRTSFAGRQTLRIKHTRRSIKDPLELAVEYHLEITNLAEGMENVFNKLLLTMLFGTLVILCFSIYSASVVQDNIKILINIMNMASTCTELLIVCYWGEQVVQESQQVGGVAYEINFVGADLRFQKGLALIIRRSQNFTKMTAGKFTDICMATFAWIIRSAYSAFMVIRGVNADTM